MRTLQSLTAGVIGCLLAIGPADLPAQSNVYTVPLTHDAPPGDGPWQSFWPKFYPIGTQVELAELPSGQSLPPDALHPARHGLLQVGPTRESWIPILLTATADDPGAFTRLYVDMNLNGDFSDDGPPTPARVQRREKTGDVSYTFEGIDLHVRFPDPERTQPFGVNFWLVHRGDAPEPDTIIRYSRSSWRSGSVTVDGVPALVVAMDGNNDALFGPGDDWSVVEASMPEASERVLSLDEARDTDRLMFLQRGDDAPDLVLEFRSFATDGSAMTFAVVDHPVSKAEDRLADDMVAEERTRPRTTTPYTWTSDLDAAMAAASASGKHLFLYFETDWCGPCKDMDQWIWTDAQVVAALQAGYVGVKLDGDIEKERVRRYGVKGYPNMLIVDPASGTAIRSVQGYQSSQQLLDFLRDVHTVPLTYTAPGEGPRPNFSPTGTRVALAEVPAGQLLPDGAVRPARHGQIQVGPTRESWIPMLLAATADEPGVLTRLYLDLNRNGDFLDEGPPAVARLDRDEETGDVRHYFTDVELRVHFPEPERTQPFVADFWMFHWGANPQPDSFIRYAGGSWRTGTVTVDGVPALVAAMDRNNDAVFGPGDHWSVVEASMPNAGERVLAVVLGVGEGEMRTTDRLMFLQPDADAADMVLEFRSFAADGSSVTFAVVDLPTSRAQDRAADDVVAAERPRPRTTAAYTWTADVDGAMAAARASGKRVFLYFETDWCAPCRIMDEWIWTDAEVAAALQAGYVGVKLDGDTAEAQVERYDVSGYPTLLVVDPGAGAAIRSAEGYHSSQQLLDFLHGATP